MPPEAPEVVQTARSQTNAEKKKMINQTSAVSLARTATSRHSLSKSAFNGDKTRLKNIIESSTVEINDSINFNRRVFAERG